MSNIGIFSRARNGLNNVFGPSKAPQNQNADKENIQKKDNQDTSLFYFGPDEFLFPQPAKYFEGSKKLQSQQNTKDIFSRRYSCVPEKNSNFSRDYANARKEEVSKSATIKEFQPQSTVRAQTTALATPTSNNLSEHHNEIILHVVL